MKRTSKRKPYWKMTAEELAEATREFDRPLPAGRLKPLSQAQRQRWELARRRPSCSVFVVEHPEGGMEATLVHLDRDLLRRCDQYARKHGMTRSQFIERSLKSALSLVE